MQASVDLPDLATSTAAVVAGDPVEVDLVLESIPEGVSVYRHRPAPRGWGSAAAAWRRSGRGHRRGRGQEIFEPTPDRGRDLAARGRRTIDLEPVVRDAVLLSLPLAPLCADDCPGPPGALPGRVEPPTTRDEPARTAGDPRWAALDDLRFDETRAA